MFVSGFKPGSTLSDPGRGQPTSLGPLIWSTMSSDGLVHPQKIIQVYLMCLHSHDIHLDTSKDYQLNHMADHHRMHPLQVMHNHPDFMTDLGSHLCTR